MEKVDFVRQGHQKEVLYIEWIGKEGTKGLSLIWHPIFLYVEMSLLKLAYMVEI